MIQDMVKRAYKILFNRLSGSIVGPIRLLMDKFNLLVLNQGPVYRADR